MAWNHALIAIETLLPWFTAVVLVFGIAASLGSTWKYLELTSHFRVQYLLAAAAALLISVAVQNWWCGAGALLAAAINASAILPIYPAKHPVAGETIPRQRLKLALVNVYRFNHAHERLVAFIERHQPEVLIVQELTDVWATALRDLERQYPFCEVLPRPEGSGIALYSRIPFERVSLTLPETDARPGILVRLQARDAAVALLTIHPRAPIRRGHFELRNRTLASAADCLRGLPQPRICAGDLNTSMFSPVFKTFVRQAEMRSVRDGIGLLPSWPTFMGFRGLMIPIDHCLVSRDIGVVSARTGERIGSDHLPLLVELEIPKTRTKAS